METGKTVIDQYDYLVNQWRAMNENEENQIYGTMEMELLQKFIQWLNLIGHHSYLRKNTEFLIFVGHCLPIDKCNFIW